MAEEVTKKDLQSLQGWVNAELKKRDAAIDRKRNLKGADEHRWEDDVAAKLSRADGAASQALRAVADLEKRVDKLTARLEKLEK